jgi:hypothetical protein
MLKNPYIFGLAAILAAAVACGGGDSTSNPVSPSPGGTIDGTDAGADGSTLKVTPPTPQAPANGVRLENYPPLLQVGSAQGKFAPVAVAHRFQILDGQTVVAEHRTSGTGWAVDAALTENKTYGWRARGEQGSHFGPWSATWTFTTPEQPTGYIRGNQVYDPLINGQSIGHVVGPVTFIPGVGARMEGFTSHIRYELPQTLTGGEFSMLVTGVPDNTEGGKTKLLSMSEGFSDITTNDRRFTLERRGNPFGIVAWRIITRDDEVSTEGTRERRYVRFTADQLYLVRAAYGGNRLTVTIDEGGAGGRRIYEFSKPYDGVYDPNPHFAYVGAPVGRGGPTDATIPGMVVRQVWLSSQPRPPFANR